MYHARRPTHRAGSQSICGSKADYYLQKWQPALGGDGITAGRNWAAFLLSGLWIPYRKMYRVAVIFFGVILIESILEVFFARVLGMKAPASFGRLVGLVAGVICFVSGNQWYLSHTRKVVADVRSRGLPEEEYLRVLSKRGGTNLLGSLGFFALFIVIVLALGFFFPTA